MPIGLRIRVGSPTPPPWVGELKRPRAHAPRVSGRHLSLPHDGSGAAGPWVQPVVRQFIWDTRSRRPVRVLGSELKAKGTGHARGFRP